jgi:hypothetical protein
VTKTRLSSELTSFRKFIVTGLHAALCGGFLVALWLSTSREPSLVDVLARVSASAIVLAAFAFLSVQRRLKKVTLVSGGVQVSNFRYEDFVPFEDIAMVRESKWSKYRDITLLLRRPCRFGRTITFIPALQLFLGARDHPTATLLRARARRVPSP